MAHKILKTEFNEIENDKTDVEDDEEIYEPVEESDENITDFVKIENVTSEGQIYQPNESFTTEILKIESDEEVKDDEETDHLVQVSYVKNDGAIDPPVQLQDDKEIDHVPISDNINEDVEIESDVEVYEEIDQLAQVSDENFKTNILEIESDEDIEDVKEIDKPIEIESDEDIQEVESSSTSPCEMPQTNSIDSSGKFLHFSLCSFVIMSLASCLFLWFSKQLQIE